MHFRNTTISMHTPSGMWWSHYNKCEWCCMQWGVCDWLHPEESYCQGHVISSSGLDFNYRQKSHPWYFQKQKGLSDSRQIAQQSPEQWPWAAARVARWCQWIWWWCKVALELLSSSCTPCIISVHSFASLLSSSVQHTTSLLLMLASFKQAYDFIVTVIL